MSGDDERRSIEEVVTLYSVEPSLRDVYVEGPSDAAIVEWFLDRLKPKNPTRVYDSDAIDVPRELVEAKGMSVGAKGRLLTFALEIAGYLGDKADINTRVVIDTDWSHIDGSKLGLTFVLYTDATSMDLYILGPRSMTKALKLIFRTNDDPSELIRRIEPTLRALFITKAADSIAGLGLGDMEFSGCCSLEGDKVVLDVDEYRTRFLNRGARGAGRRRFLESVRLLELNPIQDIAMSADGEHLISLLAWIYRSRLPAALRNPQALKRALVACLEFDELREQELFVALEGFVVDS